MKTYISLFGWLLFLVPFHLTAQQHDLDFYFGKAKENSPFIHQNENEKRLVQLDLEQLVS